MATTLPSAVGEPGSHSAGFADWARSRPIPISTAFAEPLAKLRSDLNSRFAAELDGLRQESDPRAFHQGLLELGARLESSEHPFHAATLYQLVEAHSPSTELAKTAHARLNAIRGVGSNFEFLLSRFRKEATDYRTIVPAIAGSAIFNLSRSFGMARLSGMGRAWHASGQGAEAIANVLGFSLEATSFTLLQRGLAMHGGAAINASSLNQDLFATALSLGALRLCGFASTQALKNLHGIDARGMASRLQELVPFSQGILSQGAGFLGLLGARHLETAFSLRRELTGTNLELETLGSLFSLGAGMHLGHRLLGPGFAHFQAEAEVRSRNQSMAQESRVWASTLAGGFELALPPSHIFGIENSMAMSSGLFGRLFSRRTKASSMGKRSTAYRRVGADRSQIERARELRGDATERHNNGVPKELQLRKSQTIDEIPVGRKEPIHFHENGALAEATLSADLDHFNWPLLKGDRIKLDDAGNLIGVMIKNPLTLGGREFSGNSYFELDASQSVVWSHSRSGESADRLREQWFRELQHSAAEIRQRAALALAQWGDSRAVGELRKMLPIQESNAQLQAIRGLKKLKAIDACGDLLAIVKDRAHFKKDRLAALETLETLLWDKNLNSNKVDFSEPSIVKFKNTLVKYLGIVEIISFPLVPALVWLHFLPSFAYILTPAIVFGRITTELVLEHIAFRQRTKNAERQLETFAKPPHLLPDPQSTVRIDIQNQPTESESEQAETETEQAVEEAEQQRKSRGPRG